MCLFALTDGSSIRLADFVSALTGWEFTAAELIKAGERTLTLCHSFNIREGLRASDFKFPERIGQAPPSGPLQGRTFDFDAIRKSYFHAMGWNPETGVPSPDCLRELGLEELVTTGVGNASMRSLHTPGRDDLVS